jgi:uncharacterized protein (TIGR02271 family)
LATTPAVCCESHANKEVSVTQYEGRSDRFTALEDRFAGYEVYDEAGEKIGKVDDLFVDETDSPEYIGVKMGFLGMSSTLIPWEAVSSTDDEGKAITVATDKATTKNGPTFDDDRDITPEFENEVYSYYGLQRTSSTEESGAYESYYAEETTQTAGMADRTDLADEDELRVQRTEEELAAGTREREAGQLKVRKRVRTDREHIEVPTRHEEVSVERVPVEGEATEAEIGEDEVVVPVTEEEVVVGKRPVVKEEVRVRKDVVEDTETVEEDVRREEIEVEDETATRRGL